MKFFVRSLWVVLLLISALQLSALATSSNLVVSQVYLATGSGTAQPQSQCIDLFNRGTNAVSLSGWTVQYGGGSSAWQAFLLSGSLAPGQYYLIRVSGTGGGNVSLPTPDLTISTSLSVSGGKVAVVN